MNKQKELINKSIEMANVCQALIELIKEKDKQIKYLKLTCELQELALKESSEYIEILENELNK